MYPEGWARFSALVIFLGFNLTFLPQFVLGYLGMPRRYHAYPPEFQVLNVMSSAGASILGVGYLIPMIYFLWSLKYGALAGPNPWGATGLEWRTPSPPPTENFKQTPVVTEEPYEYSIRGDQSCLTRILQRILRIWRTISTPSSNSASLPRWECGCFSLRK